MKTIIYKLAIILVFLVLPSCFGYKKILDSPLKNINLSALPDGQYKGVYGKFRWYCHVTVDVKSNRIDTIRVTSTSNAWKNIDRELTKRIIEKQSIDVDAVSGSTITSKVFLKTVENALTK